MEGNELAKSATAATTTAKVTDTDARDISGLVFGPAWLRQLSTGGDVTINNGQNGKNSSNPTSPALTFQPAKHRYSNEDLLNIFKLIEKTLKTIEPPSNLKENFEDLFKKDLQSPVALTPITLDEQKSLSVSVNSQLALNAYNKAQGISSSQTSSNANSRESNGRGQSSNNARGNARRGSNSGTYGERTFQTGSNAAANSNQQITTTNGASASSNTAGRGRGRGRPVEPVQSGVKCVDDNGIQTNSRGGGAKGSATFNRNSTSYRRTSFSDNWEGREPVNKKEYSKAMADDNWRSRGSTTTLENKFSKLSSEERDETEKKYNSDSSSSTKNGGVETRTKKKFDKNESQFASDDATSRNSKNQASSPPSNEWISNKKASLSNRTRSSTDTDFRNERNVEWLNDKQGDNDDKYYLERNPEWLQDEESDAESNPEWFEDGEPIINDKEHEMTFDESGKYVPARDLSDNKFLAPKSVNNQQLIGNNESKMSKENRNNNKNNLQQQQQKSNGAVSSTPSVSSSSSASSSSTSPSDGQKPGDASKVKCMDMPKSNSSGMIQHNRRSTNLDQFDLTNEMAMLMRQNTSTLGNSKNSNSGQFLNQLVGLKSGSFSNLNQNELQNQPQQSSLSSMQTGNADPKTSAVSHDHPDAEKWFYLDPQNQVQGPFTVDQMAAWCAAGYFSLNLMMKRGCDEKFVPFGILTSLGRIPFAPSVPPFVAPLQKSSNPSQLRVPQQQQQQQTQPQQTWTKEQLLQQMQMFQQMQQLQQFPQNFNMMRNEIASQQQQQQQQHQQQQQQQSKLTQNSNMGNIVNILQQLQQLQLQQKAAAASVNSIGTAQAATLINDLRMQQETLINQLTMNSAQVNANNSNNNNNKQRSPLNDPTVIDPAILDVALSAPSQQSTRNFMPQSKINRMPINNQLPNSFNLSGTNQSMINNFLQQQQQAQSHLQSQHMQQKRQQQQQQLQQQQQQQQQHENSNFINTGNNSSLDNSAALLNSNAAALLAQQFSNNSQLQAVLGDASIKEKLNALFEQTKREEERRRKMEEDFGFKRDDENQRIFEEMRIKQEEFKRLEVDRIKEEIRKDQQKKRLEEIIKKQEEEKRLSDELKRLKEMDSIKQKPQMIPKQFIDFQQDSDLRNNNNKIDTQVDYLRRTTSNDFDAQKFNLLQEQLNSQILTHQQMTSNQSNQQANLEIKKTLEQQALEKAIFNLLCHNINKNNK